MENRYKDVYESDLKFIIEKIYFECQNRKDAYFLFEERCLKIIDEYFESKHKKYVTIPVTCKGRGFEKVVELQYTWDVLHWLTPEDIFDEANNKLLYHGFGHSSDMIQFDFDETILINYKE